MSVILWFHTVPRASIFWSFWRLFHNPLFRVPQGNRGGTPPRRTWPQKTIQCRFGFNFYLFWDNFQVFFSLLRPADALPFRHAQGGFWRIFQRTRYRWSSFYRLFLGFCGCLFFFCLFQVREEMESCYSFVRKIFVCRALRRSTDNLTDNRTRSSQTKGWLEKFSERAEALSDIGVFFFPYGGPVSSWSFLVIPVLLGSSRSCSRKPRIILLKRFGFFLFFS